MRLLLVVVLLATAVAGADPKLPESREHLVQRFTANVKANRGYDGVTEHLAPGPGGVPAPYVNLPAENEQLCGRLVRKAAVEAVPWIKRAHAYAMKRPVHQRSPTSIRAYASCLYALSLVVVDVWDSRATKPYEPSPLEEEQARVRLRPDLKPTRGLVAALRIDTPKLDMHPTSVFATASLTLYVTLTNTTNAPVEIDPGASDFVFSFVASGKRHEVEAKALTDVLIEKRAAKLAPKQSIEIRWKLPRVLTSPFGPSFGTGGVMLKAIYRPMKLASNTLSLTYHPNE